MRPIAGLRWRRTLRLWSLKVVVLCDGELLRVEVQPLLEVLKELVTLLEDVLLPPGVEALFYRETRGCTPLPATVGPLTQGSFARGPLLAVPLLRHVQDSPTGQGHALPTQKPLVQLPAAEEGSTTREVVPGDVLLSDGLLKRVLGFAKVVCCLLQAHPLLWGHLLEPIGGA